MVAFVFMFRLNLSTRSLLFYSFNGSPRFVVCFRVCLVAVRGSDENDAQIVARNAESLVLTNSNDLEDGRIMTANNFDDLEGLVDDAVNCICACGAFLCGK